MQIRQVQVACDAIQDRLTLHVSTQANEEYRVWITRRFLRKLWPHLLAMLAGHLVAKPLSTVERQDSAKVMSPRCDQPFTEESPLYPLGSSPLLASEANLRAAGDGLARLVFREARERTLTLNIDAELMQAMCAMLRQSAEQLSWDLGLNYVAATPPEDPALQGDDKKPSLLH